LSFFHPEGEAYCKITQDVDAEPGERKVIEFFVLENCREQFFEAIVVAKKLPPYRFLVNWKITIRNDGDPSDDGTREDMRTRRTAFKVFDNPGKRRRARR
jgi:hypothetical protein